MPSEPAARALPVDSRPAGPSTVDPWRRRLLRLVGLPAVMAPWALAVRSGLAADATPRQQPPGGGLPGDGTQPQPQPQPQPRDGQPRYRAVPASRDGIGREYMGREIARVMSHRGAAWLERPEREHQERPDLLIGALPLAAGMTVADIGAGTGYHALRLARAVGEAGRVHAVDVQPQMLERLEAHLAREGIRNVRPVLGTPWSPQLPPASIDLALMVDVYHELEYPYEMLVALAATLRPDGRIALVEYRAEDARVPIRSLHRMTEAQIRLEAQAAGLAWERTVHELPWQHLVLFRRAER